MIKRLLLILTVIGYAAPAFAQMPTGPATPTVTLTLEDAISIALERNFALRAAALDVATADSQVREAWGGLLPNVEATGSYTRNIISPNPFAGSDAGGLFETLGVLDWLAYNETARTDGDESTEPIPLDEFRRRQAEGLEQAGVGFSDSDNPFAVPNQFVSQISITQALYNRTAFAAVRGARSLREINQAGLTAQQHAVIHQTRELFYGALFAEQQAVVARASASRAEQTLTETARRVSAGTLPLFERLSAEVELTNIQTQLLQTENVSSLARSNLMYALGLPVDHPVRLQGALEMDGDPLQQLVSLNDALAVAVERRPEVQQARLAVSLQEVNLDMTRGGYLPVVSAFATLGYQGTVPDDRTVVRQGATPGDPFGVTVEDRDFFDGAYWNPTVAVGARLSWTIFDGFQTRYRVQQDAIAVERRRIELEQAQQAVALDVEQALRNLRTASQQIVAQRENVGRAETAFEFASSRLATGVATQVDVRMASSQLDQAQLGYFQAVFDYLVARSALQRAMGLILPEPTPSTDFLFTTVD